MFTVVEIRSAPENLFTRWAVLHPLNGSSWAIFAFLEDAAQFAGGCNWLLNYGPSTLLSDLKQDPERTEKEELPV